MQSKKRKINKKDRTIMFLLFDNARSKQVSLKRWQDYIIKRENLAYTLANKLLIQKYLTSDEVYNLVLPKLENIGIYQLAINLFNDEDFKRQLGNAYIKWRANNG